MMAGKAQLFGDEEIRKEVLACSDPRQIKALGRKVRGFDQKVWDKLKYAIVLSGNWCKFSQNRDLREFLLPLGTAYWRRPAPTITSGASDSQPALRRCRTRRSGGDKTCWALHDRGTGRTAPGDTE